VSAPYLVEPLRVIDEAQQGSVVGGRSHQAQHCQPDEKAVRRLPEAAAKSDVQRFALRFGQLVKVIQQRCAELLQPCERKFHIGLHAGHVQAADA
jgi:hypothetical protein